MYFLLRLSGRIMFWMTWPLSYIHLRHTKRTRVLVTAGSTVLLVQPWHSNGDWSLPGGGLHSNEAPIAGALRELKEEVGVVVNDAQVLGEQRYTTSGLQVSAYYFLVALQQQVTPKAGRPEILSAKWVERSELSSYKLAPDVLQALQLV